MTRVAVWTVAFILAGAARAGPTNGQESPPAARESKRRLPAGFYAKTLRLDDGTEYKYTVFIPAQYDLHKDHKWPLIVFLHGSGEMGEDGIRETTVGLPVYISMRPTKFPFIVLMPQAHAMWFRGKEAEVVWRMINATRREYRVDDDRVYLTGLSMGGYGAWELAAGQPDVFAAIVPVCGAAPKEYLCNLTHMPVWAFHGALDKNVPVSGSREAIRELKRLGGLPPRYTEYPDLAHECWDKAYSEDELWRWLLAQRRKVPRVIDYRIPSGTARVWWLTVRAEPNLKAPARIHAEIDEAGRVAVETEGIAEWGLMSDRETLAPGQEIQVTWNGAVVYRGVFKGGLTVRPERTDQLTPQPGVFGRDPAATPSSGGAKSNARE